VPRGSNQLSWAEPTVGINTLHVKNGPTPILELKQRLLKYLHIFIYVLGAVKRNRHGP